MSSAQTMKIYSIIDQIETELEESPHAKLSGQPNRKAVDVEHLFDLLGDLKATIPEDIRRATGVIADADNIVKDAQESAEEVIEGAKQEAEEILQQAQASAQEYYERARTEYEQRVSESEIYKEAMQRAGEIGNEAETNANAIYNGAREYADSILADLQRYLSEYHSMISANRKELGIVPEDAQPASLETAEDRTFDDTVVRAEPVTGRSRQQDYYEEEPYDGYVEDEYDREPVYDTKKTARIPRNQEPEYEDDGYDEEPEEEKPMKKKGFLSKLFEVDYDDDDEDLEEEKPAPKKKAPGLKKKAKK